MQASLRKSAWFGLAALALQGCGGSETPAPGADTSAADAPAAVEEAPAAAEEAPDVATLLAGADAKRGETLYFQCRACHTMHEGGANKVGPNLWGMFGREAGGVPGFAYSDALANSGIVWTPETVNAWLEKPAEFLPGNIMVFVGVRDPQDRANLIAYLQQSSGAAP